MAVRKATVRVTGQPVHQFKFEHLATQKYRWKTHVCLSIV